MELTSSSFVTSMVAVTRLLIERAHIVRQQPANARQDRRYGDHKDQAESGARGPCGDSAGGAPRSRRSARNGADARRPRGGLPGVPSRGVVFFLVIHKRTALLFKNPKSFFGGQAPFAFSPHRIRQSMTSEVKCKCATTMTAPCVWLILIIILILFGCGGCGNSCGCGTTATAAVAVERARSSYEDGTHRVPFHAAARDMPQPSRALTRA